MLVQSQVAGDSRVLREAATLAAAGHEVHIVGRAVPAGFGPPAGVIVESVELARGLRPTTRVQRDSLPVRVARWLLLPEHRARVERAWARGAEKLLAAHLPADVIHAHDFNTLGLAVALTSRWNAKLIYDAHELWFGRVLPGRPGPVRRLRGAALERHLAARASVVLTVSKGIADRLRGIGVDDVRVVRNTFPTSELAPAGISLHPRGLVYAGRMGPGRDLGTVIEAGSRVAPLRTVLVGPLDSNFGLQLAAGVEVLPPTSLDGIDRIFSEMGIAVVPLADNCDNHRLALPNKLFHAVRAGIPVVAADLPAIRQVVTEHRLGTLFRSGDVESLVVAVRELVATYPQRLGAVREAQAVLNWRVDADVLLEAYDDLGP